ncbi:GbsR/MarR family transcriptional regulator [Actinomadura sp. WMMB 499]|uniref:GbsR/MarR family transcriptional regulator n=1 Tax=Actinomadura sp. WMMB 499 TaxID=1219491 RepID=UPI0012442E42|nr:MarR family transcriptional regulator [Actinomadura sp. WMMB 499]QFG24512.1 MarR family transcriptional regulator [Actinomadura sp. WMMB 499]
MADTTEAAERLALVLTQGGLQKSTARVLAAFMFADTDSVTAGELADRLGISSGSVSGAIKMLSTVGLIERAPAPGSRREHHRMRDGAWATLMSTQNAAVRAMLEAADEGIEATGEDSPAARRLHEMRDFYGYMFRELPALIDRWRTERGT